MNLINAACTRTVSTDCMLTSFAWVNQVVEIMANRSTLSHVMLLVLLGVLLVLLVLLLVLLVLLRTNMVAT